MRDKKANGINKNVVKDMAHEKYKTKYFEERQMSHEMNRIQNKSHQSGTY